MSSKDLIISDIVRAVVEQKSAVVYQAHLWTSYCFTTIKSIHNIDCDVQLQLGFGIWDDEPNDFNVILKIVHSNMFNTEDCDPITLHHNVIGTYKKFDRETISTILDKIKLVLSKLQFDIFRGQFIIYQSTTLAEIDFFKDIESINSEGQECPICKEHIINTKTECGHYLCVPCFQKLKLVKEDEDDDDDEENFIKKCPMCRERITFTH